MTNINISNRFPFFIHQMSSSSHTKALRKTHYRQLFCGLAIEIYMTVASLCPRLHREDHGITVRFFFGMGGEDPAHCVCCLVTGGWGGGGGGGLSPWERAVPCWTQQKGCSCNGRLQGASSHYRYLTSTRRGVIASKKGPRKHELSAHQSVCVCICHFVCL